jgi:FkbM family methyltransferase
MPHAKELLRRALTRANLDVRRGHAVPFGVQWSDDIRHYLRGRSLRVAFDVGAHRGETTSKLLRAFPGVRVYSFEPLPENFLALQKASLTGDVHAVNAAVSDISGSLTLARGEASYQTSVHGSGQKVEVQAVTVDEYALEHGVERIDLLKIDTEGHEEAVLRGSVKQLESASVEFVVCECEFTARPEERHADFHAIQDLLEPFGYRVVSFYTGGVDNLGWIWGDVLFRHAPGQRDRASGAMSPHAERRTLGFW